MLRRQSVCSRPGLLLLYVALSCLLLFPTLPRRLSSTPAAATCEGVVEYASIALDPRLARRLAGGHPA